MSRAFFDSVHADPWASDFLDLSSLNAHASGAVDDAVLRVRETVRNEARAVRSTSIVIVGPPGAGKTHLFARLRRKLGPRAVFVLIRPLGDVDMTARFVLGEVVRQLAFAPPRGVPQHHALVGSCLGRLEGVGPAFPQAVLSEWAALAPEQRAARLEGAIESLLELCPALDEVYLARLLAVPFEPSTTARALLAWLSGAECDVEQLKRIGAATSLLDKSEGRARPALETLAATAALGAPLVLVFDQLENLIDGGGQRLRAYANLVAELVDTLRGAVLVHLALDTEFTRTIEPSLNLAQRSRIVMRREVLGLPHAADREELLRLFYQHVLKPAAPFPWPLGAERLEQLAREPGYTPRTLLTEFKTALESATEEVSGPRLIPEGPRAEADPPPDSAPRSAPARPDIASEWLGRLRNARDAVRTASEERRPLPAQRIAEGLLALGRFAVRSTIRPLHKPPAQLSLQIGDDLERVAIVQESTHRGLAAVLARLARVTEQARVVVLRERASELPATWTEARSRRTVLLDTGQARWLDIEAEDCARLLALAAFLDGARAGDVSDSRGQPVTEADVLDWVEATLDVPSWPLAVALGQRPRAAQAGDAEETVAPESFIQELAGPAASIARSTLPTLQKLRVASFERLVREVLRVDPDATRASVLAALDAAGDTVRWLGRSIVFLREHD
jgi:hypothetical protein